MHVPFLDGRIEDMSESDVSLQLDKPRRPQLKDLPVDILSVSKLACSCSRLAADSGVAVTETFTRVALRLLVSHNSRLMRDCPIYDLIRLSEAAARARSPRLRELVGLFTRRFVQYLNGSGRHEIQSLGACGSIDLLWSLGELGVKYSPDEEDVESAHRRLRLVTAVPFISSPTADSLNRVPIPYLLKLVRFEVYFC